MSRLSVSALLLSLPLALSSVQAKDDGSKLTPAARLQRVRDDPQGAAKHWYERHSPRDVLDMDMALGVILPEARPLSAKVTNFQSWEEAQKFKPYHHAGAILLAKAYTFLFYGDVESASSAIRLIEDQFPYAMILEKNRGVVWVRRALRYHEHCCMLYAAMSLKEVATIEFPKECDEFDGIGQRQALEHMATLRLREGNIERLEHFFTAINRSGLQTSGGDWAIDIIMNAMCPLDTERDSPQAWSRIQAAIQLWQQKKPTSIFAQVAEARFLFNHAIFKSRRHSAKEGEVRADALRGLEILEKMPRTSPAWYDTMLRVQCISGLPPATLAPVFQEGLRKYPDYTPLVVALGYALLLGGETGHEICARALEEMQAGGKGGLAAQMLRRICRGGDLLKIKSRLNQGIVEQIIRDAVAQWPNSYELRSDLGLVAVMMDRRELAREIMKGMQGKWCRYAWSGREGA